MALHVVQCQWFKGQLYRSSAHAQSQATWSVALASSSLAHIVSTRVNIPIYYHYTISMEESNSENLRQQVLQTTNLLLRAVDRLAAGSSSTGTSVEVTSNSREDIRPTSQLAKMQVEFLAQPTHALKEVYLTLTMQVLVELEHLVKWLDSSIGVAVKGPCTRS